MSELTYRDLEGDSVTFEYKRINPHFSWSVALFSTNFSSGEARDSDYYSSNRQDEYSRSLASLEDSSAAGFLFQIGKAYPSSYFQDVAFYPYFEIGRKKVHYKSTEGKLVIPSPGVINGLDSFYEQNFNSNAVGVKIYKKRNKSIYGLFASYGIVEYEANANWNLRTDFAHPKSFEHKAGGNSKKFGIEYSYDLDRYSVVARGEKSVFEAYDGKDTTYFSDGTEVDTKLNEVKESVSSVWIGVLFRL